MNARLPQNPRRDAKGHERTAGIASRGFAFFADGLPRSRGFAIGWIALCLLLSGCGVSMYNQPYYRPLESSDFFGDQQSARHLVPGTVARGDARLDQTFYAGQADGRFVSTAPVTVSMELLQRGQQRYNIYCSPCHGLAGYGDGEIVQRGFSPPPNFHSERIRNLPDGRIYDVITNGYGAMYPYGYRVAPEDRWAIVAYVRALQLSQNATLQDVPADQRQRIQGAAK